MMHLLNQSLIVDLESLHLVTRLYVVVQAVQVVVATGDDAIAVAPMMVMMIMVIRVMVG